MPTATSIITASPSQLLTSAAACTGLYMPARQMNLALRLLSVLLVGLLPTRTALGADYAELLAKPTARHGRVPKAGPLPATRWDRHTFNNTPFTSWLLQTSVYNLAAAHEQPPRATRGTHPGFPLSSACGVWVSHEKELIIITQRLAAAESILDAFGRCNHTAGSKAVDSSCLSLLALRDLRRHKGDNNLEVRRACMAMHAPACACARGLRCIFWRMSSALHIFLRAAHRSMRMSTPCTLCACIRLHAYRYTLPYSRTRMHAQELWPVCRRRHVRRPMCNRPYPIVHLLLLAQAVAMRRQRTRQPRPGPPGPGESTPVLHASCTQGLWRKYFVLSVSRNPYSRAASTYQRLTSSWKPNLGCDAPPFEDFCHDPSVVGRIGNMFRCSFEKDDDRSEADGAWKHAFQAVEPIAPCLTTEAGELAVDFLVRSGCWVVRCTHGGGAPKRPAGKQGREGEKGMWVGPPVQPNTEGCSPRAHDAMLTVLCGAQWPWQRGRGEGEGAGGLELQAQPLVGLWAINIALRPVQHPLPEYVFEVQMRAWHPPSLPRHRPSLPSPAPARLLLDLLPPPLARHRRRRCRSPPPGPSICTKTWPRLLRPPTRGASRASATGWSCRKGSRSSSTMQARTAAARNSTPCCSSTPACSRAAATLAHVA